VSVNCYSEGSKLGCQLFAKQQLPRQPLAGRSGRLPAEIRFKYSNVSVSCYAVGSEIRLPPAAPLPVLGEADEAGVMVAASPSSGVLSTGAPSRNLMKIWLLKPGVHGGPV